MGICIGNTPIPELLGTGDGFTTIFTTAEDIDFTHAVTVWLNGQKKLAANDDGYTLTAPKTITMKVAPDIGDIVSVVYVPTP